MVVKKDIHPFTYVTKVNYKILSDANIKLQYKLLISNLKNNLLSKLEVGAVRRGTSLGLYFI